MGELLRRYRFPLTYLLLASLCVTGMASRRVPGEMGAASGVLVSLTLPLERMVTVPVDEARGWWDDLVELVQVREENSALRQRIARLEDENLQYREAIVSSERFQRLAGFRASHDVPMVPANVVHEDLSSWFQSVIIDQGTTAGIRPGMPVINDAGVVGVVSGTTPSNAKVLLLTDPQSRVDAYVQRSRARGSVRGGARHSATLEQVLRDEDVRVDDQLLTSGLGAVFPKGLVIGRVAEVERKPYGLFQISRIEPAVDFGKLEEVFVILERRGLPEPDAYTADDGALWSTGEAAAPARQEPGPAP